MFTGQFRCVLLGTGLADAPGGSRTHTTVTGHRILSPKRLPFRHGGLVVAARACVARLAREIVARRGASAKSVEGVGQDLGGLLGAELVEALGQLGVGVGEDSDGEQGGVDRAGFADGQGRHRRPAGSGGAQGVERREVRRRVGNGQYRLEGQATDDDGEGGGGGVGDDEDLDAGGVEVGDDAGEVVAAGEDGGDEWDGELVQGLLGVAQDLSGVFGFREQGDGERRWRLHYAWV